MNLNIDYMVNILGLAGMVTTAMLSIALFIKMDRLKQLQITVNNLNKSLGEMDEQAKLIMRTDMELNKAQEELDKKIAELFALNRLSRAISTTLEESQIFKRIEPEYLEELGFEKALAFLWHDSETGFLPYLDVGYSKEKVKIIKLSLDSNKELYLDLIKSEKSISSASTLDSLIVKEKIKDLFAVNSFVISAVLPKEGNRGFLFVGTENTDTLVTEGDQELITILANQLGQALENARLFDKTWRAQQELENKVEERTRQLTLALDELKKTSKRKTDFVSSVSHELRTPLTSIKGYASILLSKKLGNIPEEAKERLEKINRHTDELVHMVNDLLDISRIESGRVTMKVEPQDLKDIAEKTVDLLSVQLKEKHLECHINIPANANSVSADRTQIERVFINIIGNAIKFTPSKGKITVEAHKLEGKIQVDIADSGCGIPEEAQEAIFEEFYRVDNSINQELKGTGLGLALVKHIINAHNGEIWVTSKVGVGATFSFTLPAA
jgi:signal transduction histidine kinase